MLPASGPHLRVKILEDKKTSNTSIQVVFQGAAPALYSPSSSLPKMAGRGAGALVQVAGKRAPADLLPLFSLQGRSAPGMGRAPRRPRRGRSLGELAAAPASAQGRGSAS